MAAAIQRMFLVLKPSIDMPTSQWGSKRAGGKMRRGRCGIAVVFWSIQAKHRGGVVVGKVWERIPRYGELFRLARGGK